MTASSAPSGNQSAAVTSFKISRGAPPASGIRASGPRYERGERDAVFGKTASGGGGRGRGWGRLGGGGRGLGSGGEIERDVADVSISRLGISLETAREDAANAGAGCRWKRGPIGVAADHRRQNVGDRLAL